MSCTHGKGHRFVRRPFPEDYAGDCSRCGEPGRIMGGVWTEAPSLGLTAAAGAARIPGALPTRKRT